MSEHYAGNAAATWPSSIVVPDDSDLAQGISAIDPALEALADRTAILKSQFASDWSTGSERLVVAKSTQPPLDANWVSPLASSRAVGFISVDVQPGDIVEFDAQFHYTANSQFLGIRAAYIQGLSLPENGIWHPLDDAVTYSLGAAYAGPGRITGKFSIASHQLIDMGLELNGNGANVTIFGPIVWDIRVMRPSK